MKIDISQVLKSEGNSLSFDENLNLDNFSFCGNDIILECPLKVNGVFKNLGGVVFFDGNGIAKLNVVCGRCLKNFILDFEFSFEQKLSKNPDTDEIIKIDGNEVFIDDIILQEMCMNLPINFLCSESCKGLCQSCGKDLNEGDCDCETCEIDPRMAALKNFLK